MIDKIISHYKVIERIGEGGMGVLYLAEDLELNRKAVLKFLPPDMMNDPDINLRFKREAQSAGSLSHPNIVTIYDVGVHENKTFIAMEYVEGKTLRELIKSDELTIDRITDISIQICEGLNEAHSKGITHRDIKPENILIDEKGKVKIVDFGLAKIKNVSRGITKQDSTVGTLKYMSPEQIRNQNVDHRSDIWSFGVILYEMITGKYPFKGEHDASIFYSVINQNPEPLARYKADISDGFQRITDKALDKEPGTRYQHIDELLSDLRRENIDGTNSQRSGSRSKRSLKQISVLFLCIALVTAAGIYLFNVPSKKITFPIHKQLTYEGNVYESTAGYISASSISPDGQFIAYAIEKGDKKSIFVKDIVGGQSFEIIKGIRRIFTLRWSPQSKSLLICVELNDTTYSCFIVPKFGGNVQPIKDFDIFGILCWSPDEALIASTQEFSKTISFIKRETNEIVNSISLTGDFESINSLDWSLIGERMTFITRDDESQKHSLWTIKTDGTQQQEIYKGSEQIFSARFSNDGKSIYFLRSQNNTTDLMKVKISFDEGTADDEPEIIQSGLQAYSFSITSDNKKIAYAKYSVYSNLSSFTINEETKSYQQSKLTEGTPSCSFPKISPDRKKIAFIKQGNVFLIPIEGGISRQLTFLNSTTTTPNWSPDGEKLAFLSGKNVWMVSSDGGPPISFPKTRVGKWGVAWFSKRELLYQIPGDRNFKILDINTGAEAPLVSNDSVGWMYDPCISSDGKKVALHWNRFFEDRSERGLWVISREDSKQTLLYKGFIDPLKWSADGNWIYAIETNKKLSKILKISAIDGKSEVIISLPLPPNSLVDITPDGKIIVCAVPEVNSDVWMIENFDPDVE